MRPGIYKVGQNNRDYNWAVVSYRRIAVIELDPGPKSDILSIRHPIGAILRVSEGLDRSHAQSVCSLKVMTNPDNYLIKIAPVGDTELELWAAQRSVKPLEVALGCAVKFEVQAPRFVSSGGLRTTRQYQPRPSGDTERSQSASQTRGHSNTLDCG